MNQKALQDFARWHQQDLLDEANRRRIAAMVLDDEDKAQVNGASAWRRQIGWALIDLGARLSGGYLEPGIRS